MKTFLYGTTALVASGMMVSAALAADPISMKINGFYDAAFVLHDDDAAGTGDSSVKQDVEINVNGSTVLDSGVTVGANIEFKEQIGGSALGNEEVFAYLEGGMGRTEIGSTDGAPFKMAYTAPYVTDAHSVDTPIFWHISRFSARTTTRIRMSGDANKVTYFTPRMTGFQLGMSYTPSNDSAGAGFVGGGTTAGTAGLGTSDPATGTGWVNTFGVRSDANGGVEDIIELGGSYVGEFANLGIKLSAGYAWGDHESFGLTAAGRGVASPISADPEAWHLGANFTSMGWTLGGGYYGSEGLVAGAPGTLFRDDREEEAWNIGVTYASGPWQAGIAYMSSEQDGTRGAPGKSELSLVDVGAQYKLGPGVAISADLTFADDEVPGPGTNISPSTIEDKALALTLMLDF
ncbi:MAG: porin [Alphaproteobacteria bacterium]